MISALYNHPAQQILWTFLIAKCLTTAHKNITDGREKQKKPWKKAVEGFRRPWDYIVNALFQHLQFFSSHLAVFIQSTSNTMIRGWTERFWVHRKCYHSDRSHSITVQRSSANIRRGQGGGGTAHSHADPGWGGSRAGAEDRWRLKNHSCARKVGHRIVGLDGCHCCRRPVLTMTHS